MSFTTLDETNFPLYAVNVLDKNVFVIGGGGGSAKTGVPNAMNLYQLSRDGRKLKATLSHEFDTGRQAVMNCAVHPVDKKVLAVGMDNKCQILELDVKEEIVENSNEKKGNKGRFVATKKRTFQINAKNCVTTVDSSLSKADDDCGFQKVVKFTANGEYIITGGSDGHVKILKYPSLECLHDVHAHRTDVDDLDVHPNGKKFVTVSRDTTAYVWRVDGGKKDFQLYFTADREEGFFRVRACRFGTTENGDVRLFTIHVPSKFNRRLPTPCYLVKWDTKKWVPELSQAAGIEPLTQMAISQNGVYVAVGTSEGGVSIYVAWSLMPITQVKEVHTIFVTGLAFLPPSKLVNEDLHNEAAVLSISADDTVKVTTVGKRGEYSIWYVVVGFLILLYLTFMALAYLGVDV